MVTLVELTNVDPKLEISFLEQSDPSRSLPRSSTTEPNTVDEDQEPSTESLTPDHCKTLEYLNMTQILFPDIKEIKRSSLPSSCEFLGDLEKIDDFRSSVVYRTNKANLPQRI